MLKTNSKSPGNRVVSPEEEKERLKWERICSKGRFRVWNERESGR